MQTYPLVLLAYLIDSCNLQDTSCSNPHSSLVVLGRHGAELREQRHRCSQVWGLFSTHQFLSLTLWQSNTNFKRGAYVKYSYVQILVNFGCYLEN